jgi:signal recognition particle GTPase
MTIPAPFTLDDFLAQMAQVKKLGPMSKVMAMIPGMADMMKQVNMKEADIEKALVTMSAIYASMTPSERSDPDCIAHQRRQRIAHGAGVTTTDVIKFINDFQQSRDMMAAVRDIGLCGKFRQMPRPTRVVGLVTHNRFQRDPSMTEPTLPAPAPWRLTAILLSAIALTALAFILMLARSHH